MTKITQFDRHEIVFLPGISLHVVQCVLKNYVKNWTSGKRNGRAFLRKGKRDEKAEVCQMSQEMD